MPYACVLSVKVLFAAGGAGSLLVFGTCVWGC